MSKLEDYPLVSDDSSKKQGTCSWMSKLKDVGGYLSSFGAAFFGASGLASAQALGGYVPPFELNMWRFLVQFLICVPIAWFNKWSLTVRRRDIPYAIVACCASNLFNLTFYGASVFLPVGTVSCLHGSLLLFLSSVVSFFMDRKCLRSHSLVAMALVLVSVVCVTQPEFLFGPGGYTIHPVCSEGGDSNNNSLTDKAPNSDFNKSDTLTITKEFGNVNKNQTDGILNLTKSPEFDETSKQFTNAKFGYLLASLAGMLAVIFMTVIHHKLQEMNIIILALYISGSGFSTSLICMVVWEKPMFLAHHICVILLACHACGTSFQGLLMIAAPALLAPEKVSLICNLQLVFLFIAQYTLLKSVNPGHQNLSEVLGATGIFVGNCIDPLYNLYIKGRHKDSNN